MKNNQNLKIFFNEKQAEPQNVFQCIEKQQSSNSLSTF